MKIVFSADIQAQSESDEITFLALSRENQITKYSYDGSEINIHVDLEGLEFGATHLYSDHYPSFENTLGRIIESKKDESGLKIRVKFFEDILKSKEALMAFKAGLNDSVSVGLEVLEYDESDGVINITQSRVYEVSAVWRGADEKAKMIQEFTKPSKEDYKSTHATQEIQTDQEGDMIMNLNFNNSQLQFYTLAQNALEGLPQEGIRGKNGIKLEGEISKKANNAGLANERIVYDSFIEALRADSDLLSGCDLIEVINESSIRIPREKSAFKAYYTAEGENTTLSTVATDAIELSAKALKIKAKITREMYKLEPSFLDNYIFERLNYHLKSKLENDLINGTGEANSPIFGILKDVTKRFELKARDKNVYKLLLEAYAEIEGNSLDLQNFAFIANSKTKAKLSHEQYSPANPNFLMQDGELIGHRFITCNYAPDDLIILGDIKNIALCFFGDLEVQTFKDDEGNITFTGFLDVDLRVKDAARFGVISLAATPAATSA